MRILQIADFLQPGAYGVPEEYGRQLAAMGHEVDILSWNFDRKLAGEREFKGQRLRLLHAGTGAAARAAAMFSGIWRQRRWIAEHDAVLLHHPISGALFNLLARRRGQRVLAFFHSPWAAEEAIKLGVQPNRRQFGLLARRFTQRICLRGACAVVCLSDFMANKLADEFGLRAVVIPGGVDLGKFQPAAEGRGAIRARLGLPVDRQIILTVRRLVPRMGLENLIEAFRAVAAKHPDTLLVIGGAGSLAEKLRALAIEAGLDTRVLFTGFIDAGDLPDYYRAADLFVLPTLALEGFGLVVVEAMACGLPVLATPCGGTQEILRGLESTQALNPTLAGNDPAAIADGLCHFLAMAPAERRVFGEACLRTAREKYSLALAAARVADLLEGNSGDQSDASRRGGEDAESALDRQVKSANRQIYNQVDPGGYNRNDSIFNESARRRCETALARAAAATGGGVFLDVGTGTGHLLRLARTHFKLRLACDIGEKLLARIRPEYPDCHLFAADAESLPLSSGSVDCVAAYALLHHLYRHETFFRECHRVIRGSGVLYTDHDPNYFFNRFYRVWYRLKFRGRHGFGSEAADLAEYHNSRSPGINPEKLRRILLDIGFREVEIIYRLTDKPSFGLAASLAMGAIRIMSSIVPAKSLHTHFSIVASK